MDRTLYTIMQWVVSAVSVYGAFVEFERKQAVTIDQTHVRKACCFNARTTVTSP